jgi:uncharacterized protein YaaQ
LAEAVREVVLSDPAVEAEELDTAYRESLRAQRAALTGLLRDGVISEDVYSELVSEIDSALTASSASWLDLTQTISVQRHNIKRLMVAIVQEQDEENAVEKLAKFGFAVTRLASKGGFLRRKNVTLLIGMVPGREETAVQALKLSCRSRVEFSNVLPLDPLLPISDPIEIEVGGATVFVFEVDSYDEI